MQVPDVSPARLYLLDHALDSELIEELKDIILCAPSRVVTKILQKDLEKLSKFINIPRDEYGNVIIKAGREEVQNILNSYPAFRSQHPLTVCMSIAFYFSNHPDQSNVNTRYVEIDWKKSRQQILQMHLQMHLQEQQDFHNR